MELEILNPRSVRREKESQEQIGPIENNWQNDKYKLNHTYIKMYQFVHVKCVWFTVCQLYLSADVNKVKEDVDHS